MCELILFLALTFSYSGPETELIALINQERQAQNLTEVSINWELTRLARYRAEEMQKLEFFSFESPVYGCPRGMLVQFGIPFEDVGASIAAGQHTAENVFAVWIASDEHREKILHPEFTSVGVGFTHNTGGKPYWTLIMASPTQ